MAKAMIAPPTSQSGRRRLDGRGGSASISLRVASKARAPTKGRSVTRNTEGSNFNAASTAAAAPRKKIAERVALDWDPQAEGKQCTEIKQEKCFDGGGPGWCRSGPRLYSHFPCHIKALDRIP